MQQRRVNNMGPGNGVHESRECHKETTGRKQTIAAHGDFLSAGKTIEHE
jgi:hypothetical protein